MLSNTYLFYDQIPEKLKPELHFVFAANNQDVNMLSRWSTIENIILWKWKGRIQNLAAPNMLINKMKTW